MISNRYRMALHVAGTYLAISFGMRTALLIANGTTSGTAGGIAGIYLVGLVYDLTALAWALLPFNLLAAFWPAGRRGRTGFAVSACLLGLAGLGLLGFTSVSEWLFWEEFQSRFNFIAVDYLIYTREVVGNINQSYPMAAIWTGLGIATAALAAILLPRIWRAARQPAPRVRYRALVLGCHVLLLAGLALGIDETPHDGMPPLDRELASNGHYAFVRAFRNNDLEYERFYATLPDDEVRAIVTGKPAETGRPTTIPDRKAFYVHPAPAAGTPVYKNVVMVMIESLGADYVEALGGRPGLTPFLSGPMTEQSLVFDEFYATGLRTVRGLEAVTLSIPPTPGRAVPTRKRNRGLPSLGGVFKDNGYDAYYFYGGLSYFDNMADFFGGNGYKVFDRTDIDDHDIHGETIWGVSDEDLYNFTLRELDARHGTTSKPFFAHLMTTSNHRPYDYPAGRIDIPPKTDRAGAVKYSDWAIGRFIEQARTRPWFKDTLFVILADHTSGGRGRIDLPPQNYRIPMWIYAPGFVTPGRIGSVASQIDVGPTILALLGIPLGTTSFFGQDILTAAPRYRRAFFASYLTVGYMQNGLVAELTPNQGISVRGAQTAENIQLFRDDAKEIVREAIAWYQTASRQIEIMAKSAAEIAVPAE
ncbi:MAG: LTA synthase family protein [Rhodospirillales bacterium]